MTIKLYMTRTGHHDGTNGWIAMDRLGEVSRWVEAQFGRPDWHKNYSLDFADYSEDWACFTFHDDTMGFWTQNRWQAIMLTEEQWNGVRIVGG